MSVTFYDLLKELAGKIGSPRISTATGGSTTTLVDTNLIEPDGFFNGGTLFIDLGTPIFPRVDDWDLATHTFTFTAQATAITAGIGYMAVHPRFPLDILKISINNALLEAGKMMKQDETITIVADQERYDLPADVSDVRRVEIGTEDDDDWRVHYWWKEEGGQLRFLYKPPSDASKTLRLHYAGNHGTMSAVGDILDPRIDRQRLMTAACKHALIWRAHKAGPDEPLTTQLLNYYLDRDAKIGWKGQPIMPRDPILARY